MTKTIIIRCGYTPPTVPWTDPLPTVIARYDLHHTGKPNQLRTMLQYDADTLASAVRSWRHDTDFFASRVGYRTMTDYRTTWEKLLMPGRKQATKTTTKAEWQGFLECTLHEDQLRECDEWKPKTTEFWEHVHGMLESGIDISLSWQARDKSATVTLKDQRADSRTRGYAVSARDVDGLGALKIAVWKHAKVLIGDWSVLLVDGEKKPKRG